MGQNAAKSGSLSSSSAVVDMKNDIKIVFVGLDNSGKSSVFDRLRELDSGFVPNKCGVNHTIGYNFARIQFAGLNLAVWDLAGLSNMRTLWKDFFAQAHAIVFVVDGADSERLEEAKAAFEQVLVEEKGGVYNGGYTATPMSPPSRNNSSASLNDAVNLNRHSNSNSSSNNINNLSRHSSSSNNIINLNAGSHNHHHNGVQSSSKKHNMLILCNKQDMPNAMKAEDIGKTFGVEKLKQKVKVVSCSAVNSENCGLQDGLTWLMESLGKKCALSCTK